MDYPRTRGDAETFLWYLYHEKAQVYIGTGGGWFLAVPSRCTQLTKDDRCAIYRWQLKQCAQHSHPNAKKLGEIARFVFRTEEELLAYLKERRPALFKKLPAATRKIAGVAGGR
jgi:hypothetical protein